MANQIHIALDLDRTLAKCSGDYTKVGEIIPSMLFKVKKWLARGYKITIFTARVSVNDWHTPEVAAAQKKMIVDWMVENGFPVMDITSDKHPSFTHMIDDRAYHVIPNSGVISDMLPFELL